MALSRTKKAPHALVTSDTETENGIVTPSSIVQSSISPTGCSLKEIIRKSLETRKPSVSLHLLRLLKEKAVSGAPSGWLFQLLSIDKDSTMPFMFLRALLARSKDNDGYMKALCHSWGLTESSEIASLDYCLMKIFGTVETNTKEMLMDSFNEMGRGETLLASRLKQRGESSESKAWLRSEFNNGPSQSGQMTDAERKMFLLQHALLKGRDDPPSKLLAFAWGISAGTSSRNVYDRFVNVVYDIFIPKGLPIVTPDNKSPATPVSHKRLPLSNLSLKNGGFGIPPPAPSRRVPTLRRTTGDDTACSLQQDFAVEDVAPPSNRVLCEKDRPACIQVLLNKAQVHTAGSEGMSEEQFAMRIKAKAFDLLKSQLQERKPAMELQSLAVDAIDCLMDEKGFVELSSFDSIGRPCVEKKRFLRVFNPRKTHDDLSDNRKTECSIQAKADLVITLMVGLVSNEDEKADVMMYLAARMKPQYVMFRADKLMLSIAEIQTLKRDVLPSQNSVLRLDQFFRHREPPLKLFPRQLAKRMREATNASRLKIDSMQISLKKNSSGDRVDACFWWLEDPTRLFERLVEVAIIAGELQSSHEFSSLVKKLVTVAGVDKGGNDTTCVARIANRKCGNSRYHCQPLCQYEDGSESYENLRDTIFASTNPTRDVLQVLLDDKVHALCIAVKTLDGTVLTSSCLFLQLEVAECLETQVHYPHERATIELRRAEDIRIESEPSDEFSPPEGRWAPFSVSAQRKEQLSFQLVEKVLPTTTGRREYIGLRIIHEDEGVALAHRFQEPLFVPQGASLESEWLHVIGFLSHDVKQGLIIKGLGPASSSNPCLVCVMLSRLFTEHRPEWQISHMSDDSDCEIGSDIKDAHLRTGKYSNAVCYPKYSERTTGVEMTEKKLRECRQNCFSNVNLELISIPVHKDTLGIMHMTQGIFDHLRDAAREELRIIDANCEWGRNLRRIKEDALSCIKNRNGNWKRMHRNIAQIQKQIESLEKYIQEEQAKEDPNQVKIENWRNQMAQSKQKRHEFANDPNYGIANRLEGGAEIIVDCIDSFLSPVCKKPRGALEYAFDKAIEMYGRVHYRKEFGGRGLSNADGIKVQEQWDLVCDAVLRVSESTGDAESKARVAVIMNNTKRVVQPLLVISKAFKSQEPIRVEQQAELKTQICKLSSAWRECYPSKEVFIKLHHCEGHVMDPFVKIFEMIGRLSEEGFEATHPEVASTKAIQARVLSHDQRLKNIVGSFQMVLDSDVAAVRTKIDSKAKGASRGPYNTSGKNRSNAGGLVNIIDDQLQVGAEGLIEVDRDGALLKPEWAEVYQYCRQNRVPESWWQAAFGNDDGLDDGAKRKARYRT